MIVLTVFFAIFSAMLSIFFTVLHIRKRRTLRTKLKLKGSTVKFPLFFSFDSWFNKRSKGQQIAWQLNCAKIHISPAQFVVIRLFLTIIASYLMHLVLKINLLIEMVLAFHIISFSFNRFINLRIAKITRDVNKQLPEVCRLIANSVKAGLSLQQGIEMVSREIKEPAGALFRRLDNELKLGNSLEEAVSSLKTQVFSKELNLFNNALVIQHKSGGNLALILEEMAKTLELRKRINQEILSGTSESRFIAMVLPFMPLIAAVILNFMIPGFIKPLFTWPGLIMAVIFVLMVSFGFICIRKVSDIKV